MRHLLPRLLLLAWLGLVGCQDMISLLATPTMTPTPTATPQPTATPTPDPYSAAGFHIFLAELEAARQADRPPLVNRYLAQLPTAPITDGSEAIFLWQGAAFSLALIGDMNGWDPATAVPLSRVPGTELWYLIQTYEADARLDYKFLVNESLQLDPLNAHSISGDLGPNSVLVMPAYEPPPELMPPQTVVPQGSIDTHVIESATLNRQRTIFVYRPAGQLVGARYPSVYIHDGSDYLDLAGAAGLLDRLIAAGDIPPLVAVFVPPIRREEEYDANDDYIQFLAEELVPFIQRNYDTDPDPAQTGTLGASLGGLTAVYSAVSRPQRFGLAAGHSVALGTGGERLLRLIQRADNVPVRFHLVAGRYETAVSLPGADERQNLLETGQRLADAMERGGYDYTYEEWSQGHSWGLWRDAFGAALRYLYGENR